VVASISPLNSSFRATTRIMGTDTWTSTDA
jgi:hypothetical protein